MTWRLLASGALLMVSAAEVPAQQVQRVPVGSADTPTIPEDLFRLPPGIWAFGRQLWQGDEPCTAEQCEAGYTSGDLVVSLERSRTFLRVLAGFRGCASVAWNDYEIGEKASNRDTKTIGKRIKKTVEASAKYCKVTAPSLPPLDAGRLFPVPTSG